MTPPPSKKTKTQDNAIDLQHEQNRLLGLWSLVQDELKRKITGGDPTTIQALSELFPASVYPKVDESSKSHCVFCHANFDPRVPGQTKCIVEHETGDFERTCKWPERWEASCRNCEESWEGEDEGDLVKGYCWEGPHTDDVSDRLDCSWERDTNDDCEGGFDGCKECFKMLQEFKGDEGEDEDETEGNEHFIGEKPTAVEQKKDPEVIVIDD
jgi:hypothetical protein